MYVCASFTSLVFKEARGGCLVPWNQTEGSYVGAASSVRVAGALHCGAVSPATSELPLHCGALSPAISELPCKKAQDRRKIRLEKGRKASLERFP